MALNEASVYNWATEKSGMKIPLNEISEVLLEKVVAEAYHTTLNGRNLLLYPEEFQLQDCAERWLNFLVEFFQALPSPLPSMIEQLGLSFQVPDDSTCKELLSQYAQIKERLEKK